MSSPDGELAGRKPHSSVCDFFSLGKGCKGSVGGNRAWGVEKGDDKTLGTSEREVGHG